MCLLHGEELGVSRPHDGDSTPQLAVPDWDEAVPEVQAQAQMLVPAQALSQAHVSPRARAPALSQAQALLHAQAYPQPPAPAMSQTRAEVRTQAQALSQAWALSLTQAPA
jgi:hypothetical protein